MWLSSEARSINTVPTRHHTRKHELKSTDVVEYDMFALLVSYWFELTVLSVKTNNLTIGLKNSSHSLIKFIRHSTQYNISRIHIAFGCTDRR